MRRIAVLYPLADVTVPRSQHLVVQVWPRSTFPHFCHFGSGGGQELVDFLHADAKVSSR